MGAQNVYLGAWYSTPIGIFALVMAGFSISSSIIAPRFRELRERIDAMDPRHAGKQAAEAFKAHIVQMRARVELPPDVTIVVGDEPLPASPPSRSLN